MRTSSYQTIIRQARMCQRDADVLQACLGTVRSTHDLLMSAGYERTHTFATLAKLRRSGCLTKERTITDKGRLALALWQGKQARARSIRIGGVR